MLAFEVSVDGIAMACAGVDDWAVISLIVSANRGQGAESNDVSVSLGGLTLPGEDGWSRAVRWGEPELRLTIGSQVNLRIVDADIVDAPRHTYRADREVQEPSFTDDEIRAMRRRAYLELKKEFEPDSVS